MIYEWKEQIDAMIMMAAGMFSDPWQMVTNQNGIGKITIKSISKALLKRSGIQGLQTGSDKMAIRDDFEEFQQLWVICHSCRTKKPCFSQQITPAYISPDVQTRLGIC